MPSPATLERFIAMVEANRHVEACEQFYTVDSTMQENHQPPRVGRDAHADNERRVMAGVRSVTSTCVRPVFVHDDRVVIRWIFEFVSLDGTTKRMEELAYQRWDGELIAEETFFYDPAQLVPAPAASGSPARASLDIRQDDLTGPEIATLLAEHLRSMQENSPAESVHALDLDRLRKPEITFWTAWEGADLMGCGAIKELDPETAEIKSMRTATPHLRRGVARRMLDHIVAEARRRGYRRLYLETGSTPPFDPARFMYVGAGFTYCEPFADYVEDAFSVFMTKAL